MARWNRTPLDRGLIHATTGIALGAGAFGAVVGVAAACGWVRAPVWGWEQTPIGQVARGVSITGLHHMVVAWNEEMVFRGYGLDSMTDTVGQPSAIALLVALFAAAHGLDPMFIVGNSVAGLVLTSLRLSSGSLWMPVGYHFAWNYMQTGIFGPPEGLPSLRPLYVQGPPLWVGRPGYPEPGLISTIVQLAVAAVATLQWWRHSRATEPQPHGPPACRSRARQS